jgi:hypothetical protein
MTSRHRATAALAGGSAVSGLLAYVVFALMTRSLGADAAAPLSVLWTYWAFCGAAFTFPIQHWIQRTVTVDGESAVRGAAPRLSMAIIAAGLVLGALAWLARDALFHTSDAWFPGMFSLVTVGSALIGVVRGGLGARGRFDALAWSLVAENGLRCVLVGVLLLFDAAGAVRLGLCLVAGPLVVVLWPSALRYAAPRAGRTPGTRETARPLLFLTGAAVAQLISQAVLTGGPVVLALSGGSAREVTVLFAALALFRAPYMLALGVVPQLNMRVTNMGLAGESAALRGLLQGLVVTTAVAVVLAGVLGAWAGPALLKLVFGNTVVAPADHSALIAVGCTLAVSNLLLMVFALARNRPASIARAWVLATVAAAVAFAAMSGQSRFATTVICFLVAETAAFVAFLVVAARAVRAPVPARE